MRRNRDRADNREDNSQTYLVGEILPPGAPGPQPVTKFAPRSASAPAVPLPHLEHDWLGRPRLAEYRRQVAEHTETLQTLTRMVEADEALEQAQQTREVVYQSREVVPLLVEEVKGKILDRLAEHQHRREQRDLARQKEREQDAHDRELDARHDEVERLKIDLEVAALQRKIAEEHAAARHASDIREARARADLNEAREAENKAGARAQQAEELRRRAEQSRAQGLNPAMARAWERRQQHQEVERDAQKLRQELSEEDNDETTADIDQARYEAHRDIDRSDAGIELRRPGNGR